MHSSHPFYSSLQPLLYSFIPIVLLCIHMLSWMYWHRIYQPVLQHPWPLFGIGPLRSFSKFAQNRTLFTPSVYTYLHASSLPPSHTLLLLRLRLLLLLLHLSFPLPSTLLYFVSFFLASVRSCHSVAAELWGSVVASLLFWGFANEVTTVEEAKKYYPLFGLGANVALIFSGQYVKWVSNLRRTLAPGVDAWAMSLRYLMGAVLVSGGVLLAAYKHIQDKVVAQDPAMQQMKKFPTKKRAKMSMKESAQFLLGSKYIRDLAVLVISYGMCINIVEVSWKAKLKMAFPDPNSYSAFSAYKTYSIPCPSSQVNFDSRLSSFVSHLPVAFLFSLSLARSQWGTFRRPRGLSH